MLELFMLLFAFIGTVSWLVAGADAGGTSFYTLTHLFNLSFLPAASYFVARRLQYTQAMLREILLFLAALGAYLGFTSLFEHFGVTSLVFPRYILDPTVGIHFGRSRGPFVDTISNGGMLVVCFLALAFLSSSLTGLKRLLTLFLTLLMVPAVYFTETRAVWLGIAGVTAVILILRTTMRRTAVMVGCAMLIGYLSGAAGKFSAYGTTLFSRRQNTVDYRVANSEITWRMFEKNPFFGIGFGRFKAEWTNYFDRDTDSALTRDLSDGNHTTFLGILAELGIAGFSSFVAILACALMLCISAYRHLRHDRWGFERAFVVVALGTLISLFILGLSNDLRSAPIVNVIAFWFAGIISSIRSGYLPSHSDRTWKGTRRLVSPRHSRRRSVFGLEAGLPQRSSFLTN
jgi:O-antigen ligase